MPPSLPQQGSPQNPPGRTPVFHLDLVEDLPLPAQSLEGTQLNPQELV